MNVVVVARDLGRGRPPCPSCEATASRSWCGVSSAWLECRRCGLLRRDPLPSLEELDRLHEETYFPGGELSEAAHMAQTSATLAGLAELIARLAPPGARVLDFGARTGGLALELRARGFAVAGIERYSAARAAAAAAGLELQPDHTGVAQGAFDLVTAVEVIEHLRRPLAVLRHLRDLLAPGGRLFVTTPNRRGLKARLRRCRWREAQNPLHVVLFDRRSLERLLLAAGFVSVRALRFAPPGAASPARNLLHRGLQALGLYGGLRVVAEKPHPAASRAPAGARPARIAGRPAAEREPAALGE